MSEEKAKIEISSKNKDTNVSIYMDFLERDGKFSAFIKENVEGVDTPVRHGFLEFVGEGQNQFMTIRAPLRKKDEDGQYMTRARERDGKIVNSKGQPVENEADAAREYVYMTQRDDDTKLVFAQIATLNVKNTKADGSPTAITLISAKIFTDDEALAAERILFKMKGVGKESQDYAPLGEELKNLRKNSGSWSNFFVNQGADVLREKGFEVRLKGDKKPSVESDSPSP